MKRIAPSIRPVGERILGFLMLGGLLPLLLWPCLLIRITSRGPVFLHDDVVFRGKMYKSYRFRTTGPGTPEFAMIGRFLRRWKIDELAALWSVVIGEIPLGAVLKELTPT